MTVTAQQLATLVQEQQAAEAAALEDQAAQEADDGTGEALAVVLTAALAGWVAAFGALGTAGAGAALARYLTDVRRDIERAAAGLETRAPAAIEQRLEEATALGARHAVQFAMRAGGGSLRAPDVTVPTEALDAVRALAGTVREQLRLAARMLTPREVRRSGWRGVVAGIAAARRAVTLAGQTSAWAIHRAINSGSAQATEALGARGLWVAEPTACVRCAAYSGRLADRDGRFPGGLSLDPHQRSTTQAAIDGPPLHPACRCRVVPWRDEWTPRRGPSLPDLLREQAWRSVATGQARPSESRAARLRAARYVSAQRDVPASVRRQAQAAVAAGRF
jgi:hypothetical protein